MVDTVPIAFHYVQDFIRAIDGTHVEARLPPEKAVPYFGRKGCHTQNIMAACDFDMCFTFVSAGWEGSMHDTRIFYNVVLDTSKNFSYPQGGKRNYDFVSKFFINYYFSSN